MDLSFATTISVAASALASVYLAPVALSAIGFTSAGVSTGSVGAMLMSACGGTVAKGGLVATLQSTGAAGLGPAGATLTGIVGGVVVKAVELIL